VRPNLGVFTQPISCIGLPVIAAPIAEPARINTPEGLPIGVQLIAAPWKEASLFRLAAQLETLGVCAAPEPKA
jgi:Asp-tRNA(Asn)/Glu-tRNA(Gln) amidotransferase A subunit family amidase